MLLLLLSSSSSSLLRFILSSLQTSLLDAFSATNNAKILSPLEGLLLHKTKTEETIVLQISQSGIQLKAYNVYVLEDICRGKQEY